MNGGINFGNYNASKYLDDVKGRRRMAGDVFQKTFGDTGWNSELTSMHKKPINVDRNPALELVASQAGSSQGSSSNSTSQTSSTPSAPTTSTDSGEKTIYSVPEIYAKYANMDQEQTGSVTDNNQGSMDLYYKGQEEIKRLARAGQLVDKNGNPVSY
jgi:hypothetical protein